MYDFFFIHLNCKYSRLDSLCPCVPSGSFATCSESTGTPKVSARTRRLPCLSSVSVSRYGSELDGTPVGAVGDDTHSHRKEVQVVHRNYLHGRCHRHHIRKHLVVVVHIWCCGLGNYQLRSTQDTEDPEPILVLQDAMVRSMDCNLVNTWCKQRDADDSKRSVDRWKQMDFQNCRI